MNLSFQNHKIFLDGAETQILSGAIHYFRTLPEQWGDRLLKLKQCGFNTVETYLAWHLHEEEEAKFDFSGRLDFARFIRTAQETGLMVMVRPGPYICSECDLGGIPGWLLGKSGMRLRCDNPVFLNYTERFLVKVMEILAPLQSTCGGPVVAVQLENEYGSYGSDKTYLKKLLAILRENGTEIPIFTSDGPSEQTLKDGTLPELPATVNFRNHPRAAFEQQMRCDTGFENPPFAMELWVGKAWHWGVPPLHHDDEGVAQDIREILEDKSSVNCYMFHGGTNFGFTSGANFFNGVYQPLLTSYEVDAILDEAGNTTPKYDAVRKMMEQFRPGTTAVPRNAKTVAPEPLELHSYVSLQDALPSLSTGISRPLPEPMETFGQTFGFIQYSTEVQKYHSGSYRFRNMKDRAVVMLNGNIVATIYRNDPQQNFSLTVTEDHTRLDVLVENMGRVNFNTEMEYERKGITGMESPDFVQLMDWTIYPLPLRDLSALKFNTRFPENSEPGFYHAEWNIDDPCDTFLKIPEGIRGCVWLNGFHLGRYWNIGPQYTLYLPAPLQKKGINQLIVFDVHGLRSRRLEFSDRRIIAPISPMPLK